MITKVLHVFFEQRKIVGIQPKNTYSYTDWKARLVTFLNSETYLLYLATLSLHTPLKENSSNNISSPPPPSNLHHH